MIRRHSGGVPSRRSTTDGTPVTAAIQGETVNSKSLSPRFISAIEQMRPYTSMKILVAKTAGRDRSNVKTRPVRCVTTGIVYASTRDAADILATQGIMLTPESIALTCQGRQRSAGGLSWVYAEISAETAAAAEAI